MKAIVKEVSWTSHELPLPVAPEETELSKRVRLAGMSPDGLDTKTEAPKPKIRVRLRMRAIPLDKLSVPRPVIHHSPKIGVIGQVPAIDPQTNQPFVDPETKEPIGTTVDVIGHVEHVIAGERRGAFDEFHKQDANGTGLWESDGEERVYEYEFTFDNPEHGASLLDPCGDFEPEREVDLDAIATHAMYPAVERSLCLAKSGHSRCHRLAGHEPDFHHHANGKVWAHEGFGRPLLALPGEVTT